MEKIQIVQARTREGAVCAELWYVRSRALS